MNTRRWWLWPALGLLVLLLLLAGTATWLWRSDTGWQQLLRAVPGLQMEGAQGRPSGGPLAIDRLQWQGSGWRVVVEGLAWDDARWQWRPHEGAWLGLALQRPRAVRVQAQRTAPPQPDTAPAQPPASLRLPLALQAPALQIGRIEIDGQAPLTDLGADLWLNAADGSEHRVQRLVLQRDGLAIGGDVVVGTTGAMPLTAQLSLRPPADGAAASTAGTAASTPATAPWQATLQASGPLQRLALQAQLQHRSGAGARAQASVAPFAAWPLPALMALSAELQTLDLSTLAPGLPQTQLSGRVVLQEGLALELALQNAVPGAWDTGRVPLRALNMRLQRETANAQALVFENLLAELGGREPAGQLLGSGRWQAGRLTLQLQLQGVQPQRLDGRAPPLTVDGRITAALEGLGGPAPNAQPRGEVKLDLNGRGPRRGMPPLALQAEGGFAQAADGGLQLNLARAEAQTAGNPRQSATATANASRDAVGAWRVTTQGALQRFDPGLWWPAAARGAGQRIDARWQADMGLPAAGNSGNAALLDRVQGTAALTLDDSRWAGLAWRGQAALQADTAALQVNADMQAGRNRLRADARWPRAPPGSAARTLPAAPQGEIDLQAPDLAGLAPLARLLPAGAAAWWPQAGTLQAQAQFAGSWPALRSSGRLQARGLRSAQTPAAANAKTLNSADAKTLNSADAKTLSSADAQWALDLARPDAPLQLRLTLAGLAVGERRLDELSVTLQGSLRSHQLQLQASSPLRPPAWAEAAAGVAGPPGSTLQLRADGRWAPANRGAGGTWEGTLLQLEARSRSAGAAGAAPWLLATNVRASVTLGNDGQPLQAGLAPGRINLFGGALDWQQAQWQAATGPGAAPRFALQARLEPLRLAPWLSRWQPQFGWQGDLAVGGRFDVKSGPRFEADVVLERSEGDLSLTVEGARRTLGLSTLRASLNARDGLWQATQAVVGRSVGIIGGLQTVRTAPAAAWPAANAPLTGGLSLQVPDFAVWAPWLPPGWRLGGQLRAAASLNGRFSAPEYRGEVHGEDLSVRNLFEGIRLQQGLLDVALNGTQATIERFEFRDATGAGRLRVTGGARFGATPSTQLQVSTERLRVLDRFDRRVTLSGNAALDVQASRTALRGALTIDEGNFDATQSDAPASDADVRVINRAPLRTANQPPRVAAAAPAAQPPGPARSPLGQADVNLQLDLGRQLRLRGRGLDTLLRGRLLITTPGGELTVTGRVDAEEGSYRAYGQNLRIERGSLLFTGNVATPQLDVLALRADIDTRVGVVVTGSVANPRVRLFSEPELGQLDTLTWLLLGRAPEGLGRDDTALLQRAALALLAGDRDNGGGFLQRLGLDELSVRRDGTGAGDGALGGTILSLGKQISRRVFIGYEQALGGAGGTLQLIYRAAGRLTLRLRGGADNAVDAVWTWRWN